MTDARCEPPEGLRETDGWHWVQAPVGEPLLARWHVADNPDTEPLWTSTHHVYSGTPRYAAREWGWRYLCPVLTPTEAATLRAERDAAYAAGAEAMREAAAGVADVFPARTHGALATAPYAAAEQAAEEIAAAIRSLPLPASAWRPIETAPRDETRALFYAPAAEDRAAVWRIDYWWVQMRAWAHMRPSQPYTHWMPLAEAPE